MPDDVIELRGLRTAGIVGVLDHERAQPQPIEIDLDLHLELGAAGSSDDLTDTVDYGAACAAAERVATSARCLLLEALAEQIAAAVLALDDRIDAVTVWLRKLRPPVAQQLATSGVRITRARS
jgi:dihydroneopterin aldolase/2-amino-4-hydroxy-6-hydroxymethyldihydropteridine diphosphokinase